jgi:hypothetical protein
LATPIKQQHQRLIVENPCPDCPVDYHTWEIVTWQDIEVGNIIRYICDGKPSSDVVYRIVSKITLESCDRPFDFGAIQMMSPPLNRKCRSCLRYPEILKGADHGKPASISHEIS